MTELEEFRPSSEALNVAVPHAGRVWSLLLGGRDFYRADEKAVREITGQMPALAAAVCAEQAAWADELGALAAAGMRHFLLLGTGYPPPARRLHVAVHEQRPEAVVVYVAPDPLLCAHARALLTSSTGTVVHLEGSLRGIETVLTQTRAAFAHAPAEPVVCLAPSLELLTTHDSEVEAAAGRMVRVLPPGSRLLVGQLVRRHAGRDVAAVLRPLTEGAGPVRLRDPAALAALLGGSGFGPLTPLRPARPPIEQLIVTGSAVLPHLPQPDCPPGGPAVRW